MGFYGLVAKWWCWVPQEKRNEMLGANGVDDQILKALGRLFYGLEDDEDYDHIISIFMSKRLCNLSQH